MTQLFKQFIYCNDESLKNFPLNLQASDLTSGIIFSSYTPISQLGVQAPPGTKFYLNGSENPVIVGFTGLFEIDLTAGGSINRIIFDQQSIDWIRQNDSAMIIIDIAYIRGN